MPECLLQDLPILKGSSTGLWPCDSSALTRQPKPSIPATVDAIVHIGPDTLCGIHYQVPACGAAQRRMWTEELAALLSKASGVYHVQDVQMGQPAPACAPSLFLTACGTVAEGIIHDEEGLQGLGDRRGLILFGKA